MKKHQKKGEKCRAWYQMKLSNYPHRLLSKSRSIITVVCVCVFGEGGVHWGKRGLSVCLPICLSFLLPLCVHALVLNFHCCMYHHWYHLPASLLEWRSVSDSVKTMLDLLWLGKTVPTVFTFTVKKDLCDSLSKGQKMSHWCTDFFFF